MPLLLLSDLAWMAAASGAVLVAILGLKATRRRPD